jgi:hypothetical protein
MASAKLTVIFTVTPARVGALFATVISTLPGMMIPITVKPTLSRAVRGAITAIGRVVYLSCPRRCKSGKSVLSLQDGLPQMGGARLR